MVAVLALACESGSFEVPVEDSRGVGTTLCASGGPIRGSTVQGFMCLSPLEAVGPAATDGTTTWKPGPIGRIQP